MNFVTKVNLPVYSICHMYSYFTYSVTFAAYVVEPSKVYMYDVIVLTERTESFADQRRKDRQ